MTDVIIAISETQRNDLADKISYCAIGKDPDNRAGI